MTGEEVSDKRLNKVYKIGRQWRSRHAFLHSALHSAYPLLTPPDKLLPSGEGGAAPPPHPHTNYYLLGGGGGVDLEWHPPPERSANDPTYFLI